MKPKLTKKQLGKRYLELRESIKTSNFKTYTQDKLAKDLGITKTQISDLERGEKYISITELVSYAEYFNVTMEYLLGSSNNKYHKTYNIGATLGLSDKAIQTLHSYSIKNKSSDFNYMQLINFLIENISSDELERIDRYLFAKPTSFLIRDEIKNDYKNSNYVAVCSEIGDYEFNLKDMQNLLFLDIQNLLSELQNKAYKLKRHRVKFIETKELNESVSKIIGESENGEHSSTQE